MWEVLFPCCEQRIYVTQWLSAFIRQFSLNFRLLCLHEFWTLRFLIICHQCQNSLGWKTYILVYYHHLQNDIRHTDLNYTNVPFFYSFNCGLLNYFKKSVIVSWDFWSFSDERQVRAYRVMGLEHMWASRSRTQNSSSTWESLPSPVAWTTWITKPWYVCVMCKAPGKLQIWGILHS